MDDFPTKNRKRAWRRHMKMKMKRKARNIGKYIWKHSDEQCTKDQYLADNLKKCSCEMCCNLRSIEGPTLSEKRNEQSFKDQLTETQ